MKHNDLVRLLCDYFNQRYSSAIYTMMTDHGCGNIKERPPNIWGYIPDVYIRFPDNNIIIAEAKTKRDFESDRSQLQIQSFLNWAQIHNGQFYLATPWNYSFDAAEQLRNIVQELNITIECWVVHELSQVMEERIAIHNPRKRA